MVLSSTWSTVYFRMDDDSYAIHGDTSARDKKIDQLTDLARSWATSAI